MSLSKFESMLKTNSVFFFDSVEFEEIIQHYLDTGKHALAKKALKLGLEQHPSSSLLKLLKVELLIFNNDFKKAMQLLQELEQIAPKNDEVFIQKATIFSKRKEHQKAIETLFKALEISEIKEDIWAMIGMEYLYLDNFNNARIYFEKCLEIDIDDYASLYNVIYCFDMEEKHKEAILYLQSYIDKNPYCEVAWHQLGRQFYILNNFEKALEAFDYAVLIDEDFIGGYLEKAKTLEELKRYDEAIENYLITIELDDPTAYAYLRMGKCYLQLLKFSKAIAYFKKAVVEDPLLDKAWKLLADLYLLEEDYKKALYYIHKALQIDENNILYWRVYAKINLELNFYQETIKAFYNCIDLGDITLEIYTKLADIYTFLGDYNSALKELINAKNIYKNFAEIEYRLCGVFMLLKKEKYSYLHLKNAIAISKDKIFILKHHFPTVYTLNKVQEIINKK